MIANFLNTMLVFFSFAASFCAASASRCFSRTAATTSSTSSESRRPSPSLSYAATAAFIEPRADNFLRLTDVPRSSSAVDDDGPASSGSGGDGGFEAGPAGDTTRVAFVELPIRRRRRSAVLPRRQRRRARLPTKANAPTATTAAIGSTDSVSHARALDGRPAGAAAAPGSRQTAARPRAAFPLFAESLEATLDEKVEDAAEATEAAEATADEKAEATAVGLGTADAQWPKAGMQTRSSHRKAPSAFV
mmetsp:Transcript_47538/g.153942  ORF Transcript_47538/g.153942 Transcript_47538/m.153942 type:complete len:248 (+) Transcript_47538:1916-2659(+)